MELTENNGVLHFVLEKNPYDEGNIFTRDSIDFVSDKPNILIGCNGSGKTSILFCLKKYFKSLKNSYWRSLEHWQYYKNKEDISKVYIYFDGRKNPAGDYDEFAFDMAIHQCVYSEGEYLSYMIMPFVGWLGKAIKDDKVKEIMLIMDASDSGMDLYKITEVLSLFDSVLEEAKKKNKLVWIIASANQYEWIRDFQKINAIDARTLKPKTIKTYNDYRKFIIKSNECKEKRYKKWDEKKKNKEVEDQ